MHDVVNLTQGELSTSRSDAASLAVGYVYLIYQKLLMIIIIYNKIYVNSMLLIGLTVLPVLFSLNARLFALNT